MRHTREPDELSGVFAAGLQLSLSELLTAATTSAIPTPMANEIRTVTVTVGNDPSVLGDEATHEDLLTWAKNVCLEIESRFGVSTLLVRGSTATSADCDDPEIHSWLRQISQSDEWMQYL